MNLSLCVVTILFIPTAKLVIWGRFLLFMASIGVSYDTLFPILSSTTPRPFWYVDNSLLSIIQHDRTVPVFCSKMRRMPSIPPTAKLDLSFWRCRREYTMFGLTRDSHKDFIVLIRNVQNWMRGYNLKKVIIVNQHITWFRVRTS